MSEPWLKFTVICPECRNEEAAALPLAVVADALVSNRPIKLHTSCHDISWTASEDEIARLRRVLAAMNSETAKSPGALSAIVQNTGIRRTKPSSQLTAPR